jgi:UDP-N-acetylglucosamine:LPS N-acetylglucosamine transferase
LLRIMLVASAGGHLAQLRVLEPWWRKHERVWITFDKADALSTLTGEHVLFAYHPTTRNLPNLLRNFALAARVIPRSKPDLIISTGAGVAFPFFVIGRLCRIPSVYLEVFDRVDSITMTGRLCRPLATAVLVQWPEQLERLPGAELVGNVL